MTTATFLHRLVHQLRRTAESRQLDDTLDTVLLDRFQISGDPDAFATIVRRHGARVLAVCRKVLSCEADVEDAFQAVFVVLFQSAGSIRQRQALGGWLCGVAHRIALKARANAARRQRAEQRPQPRTTEGPDFSWREACAILHEELDRLPDKYRLPLILCYLEGRSCGEAARQLGVKTAVLRGRLRRGRDRLRSRLTKRGIALSVGLLAATTNSVTAGGLPESLLRATLEAATSGRLSASVAAFVHGAAPSLTIGKFKLVVLVVLALGLFSGGVSLCMHGTSAAVEPQQSLPRPRTTAAIKVSQRQEEQKKDEAAKDEETKTVVVGGVVLTPDGKPCAGAKLFVPRFKIVASKADYGAEQVGTSGADGHFRVMFKVPTERVYTSLIARADGFGVNWIEARTDQPAGDVMVKLVKDQPITGRVLGTEGKPVAGVTVGIRLIEVPDNEKLDDFLAQWKTSWQDAQDARRSLKKSLSVPDAIIGTTTTDSEGQFKLTGAGVERIVQVVIHGRGVIPLTPYVLTRPGSDPKPYNEAALAQVPVEERAWRDMWLLSGPDAAIVVQLGKVVEGVVRDRTSGKPLAGVRVNTSLGVDFGLGRPVAVTDANGKYRLEGLPSQQKYEVYAAPPEDGSYLCRSASAETTPGITPIRIDLELVRGVVVSGRVIDKQTGKGVKANVRMIPLLENKHSRQPEFTHTDFSTRSTDREGRFRLVTIPGKSLLFAEVPWGFKIDSDQFAVAERREWDEEMCPYAAARPDAEHKNLFRYDQTWGYWRFTSALGEDALRFHAFQVKDLKEDESEVKVELSLERGRTAKVLVQDADGKPLTGVRVGGVTANFQSWSRLKDESVGLVYGLDPTQPRQLTFLHLEKNLGATAVVRSDEQEAVVKLVPLGAATGRFVDAEGRPLAGIEVWSVFRESIPGYPYGLRYTKTDREGRFTLPSILPGRKFRLQMMKNFVVYAAEAEIGFQEVESGKTLDLGEQKLKPQR